MKGKKNYTVSKFTTQTPVIYPELSKKITLMNQDTISKSESKEIGKNAISLLNSLQLSIYKKLFTRSNKDFSFNFQDIKNIRNIYLKKLVESNLDNFPSELMLDEYKPPEITKEDKVTALLNRLKEEIKLESRKKNPEVSRKSSVNIQRENLEEGIINDRSKKKSLSNSQIKEVVEKNKKKDSEKAKENDKNNGSADEDEEQNEEQSFEEENYINDDGGDSDDGEGGDDFDDMDEGGEY